MIFNQIVSLLKKDKLAARRYEKDKAPRFRDCVTVCQNGRILFQRFNMGEAAGLVCEFWSLQVSDDGQIVWDDVSCTYSAKDEAPQIFTGFEDGKIHFDSKPFTWSCEAEYKTYPKAGLGFLKMLFAR